MKSYVIDCDRCQADAGSCGDCLISMIADPSYGQPVRFTPRERDALDVLVDVGLVPPLRLVVGE